MMRIFLALWIFVKILWLLATNEEERNQCNYDFGCGEISDNNNGKENKK